MMNIITKIIPSISILLCVSCGADKKVSMTARRSEGLTTTTILFYRDGTYSVDDATFLDKRNTTGKYIVEDSLITLTPVMDTTILKSHHLLLSKDIHNNLVLYQLDKNKMIDKKLPEFNANVDFSDERFLPKTMRVADKQTNSETNKSDLPKIGEKIQGDFDGDGRIDTAVATKTKKGKGNPVEDGTPDEYEVQFPGGKLKPIAAGCCDIRLVNEGDLNNDGTDEISIFQGPMNGCTYSMRTYSFTNGKWKQVIETFLIPTACDYVSDDELQKRVFRENSTIYYFETDVSGEKWKLIKKKVKSIGEREK